MNLSYFFLNTSKILVISFLCIGLAACGDANDPAEPSTTDSLFVDTDSLLEEAIPTSVPEPDLLGIWKMSQMWVGSEKLPQTPGESLIEIKEDGTIISQAPNLSAISSPYTYKEGVLAAEALGGEFNILSLTATELVLAYTVDGEQVKNVYERKE